MGFEIDFLPVGENKKSGDAICIRFGNLQQGSRRSEQTVIVVDGGFSDDGNKIVQHVERYYNTEEIDLVISTHPDSDHVSGLHDVLDRLTVKKLWMHQPWLHTNGIAELFERMGVSRITV